MTPISFRKFLGVSIIVSVCSGLQGQGVKVILNQPAQRDATIAAGEKLLANREKSVVSDEGAADPFVGKIEKAPVEKVEDAPLPVVKVIVDEAELLRNLANQVSARGTAILGADKFLLLGQKRLKVGESTIINFDGKDYEVWLEGVTSTTFTIRRNNLSYTRAVLISR